MSMKKAFDQTIRDIKREVNKKVRKVPSVEQKVLDATSNEPWGPHGSLLADVAQATKHHHEYPIVMSVIWKRINDTGKNWRHVYKALTILEYLVAHGSERVIDEIREHAYQISTLSDFQYIDSSGRDQGSNVRRKSQSLVLLVNDKERVQEVRQKAASNRDKFRSPSAGGMYRPTPSGGYGDDRYDISGRDDERNTYGRERDDDRYGKYGDGYNRRDSEEHYDRDSYRDDSSKGRRSSDGDQHGARSRSSDRYGDRVYDDDASRSSRGSNVTERAGDHPRDGRPLERKYSEQNLSAPPSYEEAVSDSRSPVGDSTSPTHSERSGETTAASAPQSSSPIANATQSFPLTASVAPQSSSSTVSINPSQVTSDHNVSSLPNVGGDPFDEFDPRGSFPAPPSASNNAEMDLFGSLSEVFAPNPLAIVPVVSGTPNMEAGTVKDTTPTFAAEKSVLNQSFEDPFGDTPFKATSTDGPPTQNFTSMSSFQPEVSTFEPTPSVTQKAETANPDFLDAFPGLNDDPKTIPSAQTAQNPQVLPEDPQLMQENDILAGILPPSQAAIPSSTGLPPEMGTQTVYPSMTGFMPQAGPTSTPFDIQNIALSLGQHTHQHSFPYSSAGFQAPTGTFSHQHNTFLADVVSPSQPAFSSSSSTPANSLALVPQQPAKQRFEPKSAVWTDTLNRGLVNLDISGPKTNPMADLGIDFETLNRKDKRMEKPTTSSAPATSNVSMGKAMGSGTGMGRAGAGSLRPLVNPMIASGMGMGMGMGMPNGAGVGSAGQQPMGMGVGMANGAGVGPMGQQAMGMGMGGYGTMGQQPMAMGGMGMGMGMAGMNMRMGQGAPMQPPNNGLAPGSNMNNYNPMMGRGGYPQQPYGGGY